MLMENRILLHLQLQMKKNNNKLLFEMLILIIKIVILCKFLDM